MPYSFTYHAMLTAILIDLLTLLIAVPTSVGQRHISGHPASLEPVSSPASAPALAAHRPTDTSDAVVKKENKVNMKDKERRKPRLFAASSEVIYFEQYSIDSVN